MGLGQLDNREDNSIDKLRQFFEYFPERIIEQGENFIQAGEDSPVFLMFEGKAMQYHISDKGDKLLLCYYQAGDLLSHSETVNGLAPAFYAEAIERSVVRIAPRFEFRQFLEGSKDALLAVLKQVSRDEHNLKVRLSSAMGGGAEGRVLQELIIIQGQLEGEGGRICITEAVLASQTGLARETVNRALKRLSMKGAIRRPRRGCIELVG